MDEILKQEMQKELTTRILRTHHRTGGINTPGR